ncbi:MAG TPA: hypothetical protein VGL83_05225 [Stellaceae bacterium]|jgi:uncharacterized membrane protein
MLLTVFLTIHIAAGTLGLASGTVALLARKGERIHRRAGTLFFYAMVANTLASFVLATLHPSAFLFAIGVFSLYLVFAGWRAVVARGPKVQPVDWAAAWIMIAAGLFMIGRAGNKCSRARSNSTPRCWCSASSAARLPWTTCARSSTHCRAAPSG